MSPRRASGRPRAVTHPVVDTLETQSEELARRWLLALMEGGSLATAARVPVDALAADGPGFCETIVRAVRSDEALTALVDAEAAGPAELVRLAGATDPPSTVSAAEALRRALREVAAGELSLDDTDVLAELSDRLAHVCAQVAASALAASPSAREAAPPPVEGDAPAEAPLSPDASGAPAEPPLRPAGEAEPLWLGALQRQVADGGRFGLLLVELDGADRLGLSEGPEAARELFARAGRAVRSCVRRPDLLAHEDDGRIWLIAPEAGRAGAASLAARVADAIERAASARGTPLTASIGVALYPDDGRDTEELMAQAEEGAYAARASGVRVAGGPDEPAAAGPRLVP